MNDKEQLQWIVDAMQERKAEDIKVLDLQEINTALDYFVICTASAGLQINAVQHNIKERLREHGVQVIAVEGPSERWVLMNYGTVVVHIMTKEARAYYDLEGLWMDARVLAL